MQTDERREAIGAWAALAGLAPLYVVSNDLTAGLVLGVSFLVVHSSAAAVALLLPARFGRSQVFAISMLAAAVAASLSASVVRLLDPFLFESTYELIFLSALTIPVLRACVMPDGVADRERAMENVMRGLGYAVSVALFGAVREFIASGAISISAAGSSFALLPIAAQPAGAFILMGSAAAAFRAIARTAKGSER